MDDGDEPVPYVMDEGVLLPLLFPPPLPADDDATGGVSPSWVYLEDRAYVSPDAVSNSTTAFSTTTTGVSIHVSFCLARPPRLSYLCVHCPRPGDGEGAYRFTVDPQVLGTHTDVALLRVPHPNDGLHRGIKSYDYFVYTARPGPGASSLRLLPNPRVSPFRNEEVAIVRCSGGARYVIACLMPTIRRPMEFKVMRFDSDVGRWKSTAVSISEPVERDRVLPIPDTASQVVFHCTTKPIPFSLPLDDDLLLPLLFPPPLPADDDDGGGVSPTPSWVYLDASAYVSPDAVSNATTAVSTTTTGVRIHVSFCLARPPRLSYLCVHCPRPGAGDGEAYRFTVDPRVISTHADVALLLVPHPNDELYRGIRSYDYFVYTASPRPSLRLLPNPHASPFSSDAVAIVRCSGGARYIIAGLMPTIRCPMEFKLQRFDSDVGRWTSTAVSVDEPAERDRVLPIPDTATEVLFHYTTKVITLAGGDHAMAVGWVDLWRGILLCDDVLDEHPVLRDLPLPKPARRNRKSFCRAYPHGYRDITVVVQDSAPSCRTLLPPASSQHMEHEWKDWHRECTVDVTDIAVVDNVRYSELLPKIGNDPEETLRRLLTGHPTLGMDGNVISFLSKIGYSDDKGWVISVDLRDKTLQGVTEHDHRKNSSFMRYYITSEISKYLINATEFIHDCFSGSTPRINSFL
uniref:DUF1618 domain-containing protein n=1 Tax=Oryza barthii TaxID=65489 RepID=A0A0D3EZR3_9ORYZ